MMNLSSRFHRFSRRKGFALVITLIMLALAAGVSIAFMSSTSLERLTANSFTKRARAEMAAQSGLAAALNQLAAANDFRFITAVTDDGDPVHSKPVLIPFDSDPTSGKVTLNNDAKRSLFSNGTDAKLTLSATSTPRITRSVGYVPITTNVNGAEQETQRYAFYVDEAGGRQNLATQGGTDRIWARDPNEVPIVTIASPAAPLNSGQIDAIKNQRPLLFTPLTANPVLSDAGAPLTPPMDDYAYTAGSGMTNVNPDAKPRVNLTKLKTFLDGLAVDQGSGNDKASVVDRLLNSNEGGNEWGGGNLSVLSKLGRYSNTQAKQTVANLIDYLDDDLIPTTDNVDNPTYFGVEGKADTSGKVTGHPYINFVGTGMILNKSRSAARPGGLNSTRVLVVLGIVNPWSQPTKNWPTFYTKPEIEITVLGTAENGTMGSNASSYFHGTFNTTDDTNELLRFPVAQIPPNTGYTFPATPAGLNYATFYGSLEQPSGMVFRNLRYQINKLRLKYTSNDGRSGYVQVLDNLKTTPQPADPDLISLGFTGDPTPLIYKFASGSPNKKDFHLNSDPRLGFVSTNWSPMKSTENGGSPPTPQGTVNVFSGHDPNNYDFAGAGPSVTNHLWYTKTDITADFYVKSPSRDGAAPKLDSAGELGFVHTGIPWETLRLYVTGDEATGKERDKDMLAHVQSGTFAEPYYGTVPTHTGEADPASPVPLVRGTLNVNNNKKPTLESLFLGAGELSDSDATEKAKNGGDDHAVAIANAIAANGAATPFALPGDFLSLPGVKEITNAQPKDFDREIVARRTANVLGTQSTRFTVYALGEARDKIAGRISTTSTVNLRAEVELQTDSHGKPVPKVISTAYYLTN